MQLLNSLYSGARGLCNMFEIYNWRNNVYGENPSYKRALSVRSRQPTIVALSNTVYISDRASKLYAIGAQSCSSCSLAAKPRVWLYYREPLPTSVRFTTTQASYWYRLVTANEMPIFVSSTFDWRLDFGRLMNKEEWIILLTWFCLWNNIFLWKNQDSGMMLHESQGDQIMIGGTAATWQDSTYIRDQLYNTTELNSPPILNTI